MYYKWVIPSTVFKKEIQGFNEVFPFYESYKEVNLVKFATFQLLILKIAKSNYMLRP